eukprot:609359-Rhodomonas_salina.1
MPVSHAPPPGSLSIPVRRRAGALRATPAQPQAQPEQGGAASPGPASDPLQTTLDEFKFGVVSSLYPNGEYAWVDLESGRASLLALPLARHQRAALPDQEAQDVHSRQVRHRVLAYIHGKCLCCR